MFIITFPPDQLHQPLPQPMLNYSKRMERSLSVTSTSDHSCLRGGGEAPQWAQLPLGAHCAGHHEWQKAKSKHQGQVCMMQSKSAVV